MKPPKNFYNAVDRRKLGLEDGLLPDVTTSDAGKVLKVGSDGNWGPADDGGAQIMTVTITYDSEQEEYSADKTHAEIIAAIAAGVIVTATYNNRTFVYAGKNQPSAFDAVYFSYLQADSASQFIGKIIEIDEDDRIVFSEHDLNNDSFRRYVFVFELHGSAVDDEVVTFSVPHLENDTLVDLYPDANHIGVYPSAISYDLSNKTISLTFTAPTTAGVFVVVVWG